MSRFADRGTNELYVLGRFGDIVEFDSLPFETKDVALAQHFGAVSTGRSDVTYESCGSPGEVASEPSQDHMYSVKMAYVS